ncbi:MAG: hypothetical protein WCR36_11725 [Bacteroidaceae bacterium]
MNDDDELLNKITEYSAALLTPFDIAVLLSIDDLEKFTAQCLNWVNDPIYRAYHKGRTQTKLELHEKVIKLAKAGSPKADELANDWLINQNLK